MFQWIKNISESSKGWQLWPKVTSRSEILITLETSHKTATFENHLLTIQKFNTETICSISALEKID